MHPLMEYRNDKELESKAFKQTALNQFEKGELNKEQLEKILDEMFQYGHYVGHCQGEYHVKQTYGIPGGF